jgi:hypothetical protein
LIIEGGESASTDTAAIEAVAAVEKTVDSAREAVAAPVAGNSLDTSNSDKFFSPLVYLLQKGLQLLN